MKKALWGLLGLVVLLLLWGLVEPYLTDVEREVAVLPDLPAAWDGAVVAQISDFQIGMWGDNEPAIRRAVERIVEAHPDLVLLTGDFVYHAPGDPTEELETVAALLRPLAAAGLPLYAVLGNHDYNVTDPKEPPDQELARRVTAVLEAAGVRVLKNEAVQLPPRGPGDGSLYLVGIGPVLPGRADVEAALRDVPDAAPRLVMMHNPAAFDRLPSGAAPLAVAGHTHGGQVRVPFLPEWSYLNLIKSQEVHADGWIDGYGAPGNRLYVNRGLGLGIVPIRINCIPELTLFTLRREDR